MRKTIIACLATALVVGGGTATAASLITSANIKDGTIQKRDIAKNQISMSRLTPGVRALIKKARKPGKDGTNGVNGQNGVNGHDGANGAKGDKGDAGPQGIAGPQGPQGPAGPVGPQGPQGGNSGLPAGFWFTNNSVGLTASGVLFGPYADGGAAGGSVYFTGLNGKTLAEVSELVYTFNYTTSNGSALGAPYMRIFLNGDTDDVLLDPTECATAVPTEGEDHTLDITDGTKLRYSDDPCGASYNPQTWDEIVADHGDEMISGVYVTTGFAGGQDVRTVLRSMRVNGESFDFGA